MTDRTQMPRGHTDDAEWCGEVSIEIANPAPTQPGSDESDGRGTWLRDYFADRTPGTTFGYPAGGDEPDDTCVLVRFLIDAATGREATVRASELVHGAVAHAGIEPQSMTVRVL